MWTLDEVREVLGDELGEEAIAHFGMTERGNFEGRNIPVRATPDPPHRDELRRRLYEARAQRVWPGLDDKRLTGWNALMVSALADAGAVLDEPLYRDAAVECADFLVTRMRDEDGRLLRTYNRGQARLRAVLEDHAFLLEALLDALRGDVRPALVRRGAGARRHDPRALRGPRERRLLLDRGRPRAADHAPQGHRGQPDPGRPVGRLPRACCGSPR